VIRSGAGDDIIGVSDTSFARIDGGTGTDTLRLDGAGVILDLRTLSNTVMTGIEAINITGSGNNALTLKYRDVIALSDAPNEGFTGANSHNSLVITGNAGDAVNLQGDTAVVGSWTSAGSAVIAGQTYNVLDYVSGGDVLASVAVHQAITTTLISGSDPIVLDLRAPGISFTSLADGVQFDINGDGALDQVAWTGGEDGILTYDLDRSGKIEDGSELFSPVFDGGSYASSLVALASLDTNSDGLIDANDAAFADLSVWQDQNHDGISDAGELNSLTDLAIASISLNTTSSQAYLDGQEIFSEGGFAFADGSTGNFVEVALDAELGTPLDALTAATEGDAFVFAADSEQGIASVDPGANSDALASATQVAMISTLEDNFIL
jgi:hypothetical protein